LLSRLRLLTLTSARYVQEILQSVSKSTDQVTIEPNGEWHHTQPGNEQTPRPNGHGNGYADSYDDDDSEDDLVDITDSRSRISAIKSEAVPTPQSLARTPPLSSREASSAPRTGNKRASEVIDLTLSDEDEPPRPAKKVAYNTPTSLPDPVHRYQQPPPTFGSSSVPMRPQAQSFNSIPAMRLDPPRNHPEAPPSYRPPPPRNSFSGYGSSTHPTYLGSSP
jgi:E3 SUMO-protein ligase PIAS1